MKYIFTSNWSDDRLAFKKGEPIEINNHFLNRVRDTESCIYYAGSMIPKTFLYAIAK